MPRALGPTLPCDTGDTGVTGVTGVTHVTRRTWHMYCVHAGAVSPQGTPSAFRWRR